MEPVKEQKEDLEQYRVVITKEASRILENLLGVEVQGGTDKLGYKLPQEEGAQILSLFGLDKPKK